MQRRAFLLAAVLCASPAAAAPPPPLTGYRSPTEVRTLLESWCRTHSDVARLVPFGKSAGGRELLLLQIAAASKDAPPPEERPAILVVANLEGSHLVGTEGALRVAETLLERRAKDPSVAQLLSRHTVYVAPLMNPDAAASAFATPRLERQTNDSPVDSDLDTATDEDGPQDLDGDGLITTMRVREPDGKLVADPDDPRLLRPAEAKKGESGIYALYTEGVDDDGDNQINEDGPGGVELARDFPHDFEHASREAGLWPASQPETIALLELLSRRRAVALVLGFSRENTFLNLQQTGRAQADTDKVRVPERFAELLGVEPDSEMDVEEAVERIKAANVLPAAVEVTKERVIQMMGGGPAVAIDKEDLPLLEAVQKEYKDTLSAAKIEYPEKRARGVGRGSFFAWCYFQLGVPVFSSDLWAFPDPPAEKDAAKDTPKAAPKPGAAAGTTAEPSADALYLKWSDSALGGAGFVPWRPFKHPTLGDVEIGGFVPLARANPPASEIGKATDVHAELYLKLMQRLPELSVKSTTVEPKGADTYKVTVHLANTGWFPTATAQGRRARTAWPVTVRLTLARGQSLFSGLPIESIPSLAGSGGTRKLEWVVRGPKGSTLELVASAPRAGTVSTKIALR
jgi:hypothetical protein